MDNLIPLIAVAAALAAAGALAAAVLAPPYLLWRSIWRRAADGPQSRSRSCRWAAKSSA
jgi:hypothetical protein